MQSSTESARAMLADQIEKKGEEKDKEKLDRKEAQQTRGHPRSRSPAGLHRSGRDGTNPAVRTERTTVCSTEPNPLLVI